MTETELNANLSILLTEHPVCEKPNKYARGYRREKRTKKNDKLLRIIRLKYIPHAGYIDGGYEGRTLLHSGKYIKYPRNSNCRRWIKQQTAKKVRHYHNYNEENQELKKQEDTIMRQPFTLLTLEDVEFLRKQPAGIPGGYAPIVYAFTQADIAAAISHLQTLYDGRVTATFAEKILIRNQLY